ncbi:O-antigen ligase family protein [Telmatospirillum siberiense]|uniref:O-antigen ligase family protein n=1 Tax=Telmatospirillum siberiense TaxID=382514 RepID=UPI0011AEC8E7|nr:O-antigen ligase family protein [Telmatospirillum siberiense]
MTKQTIDTPEGAGISRLAEGVLFLAPLLSLQKALVMAPLLSLLSIILLFGMARAPSRWAPMGAAFRSQWPLTGLFAALALWILAACFWSFDALFSLRSLAMLIGTTVGGWVLTVLFAELPPARQARMVEALAAGLVLAGLVLLTLGVIERLCRIDIGRLFLNMDAATTVIAVLLWPTLAWLVRGGRRPVALVLFLVSLGGVGLAHDLAAKVALAGAGVTWLLARWRPGAVFGAIMVFSVAGCLLAPLAALHLPPSQESAEWEWLPSSAHHRLTIWSFTARHVAEHPLFGWGFDGARAIPDGKTRLPVARFKGCPGHGVPVEIPGLSRPAPADCVIWEEQLPLHPHDGWLQIWLELGAVGAGLTAFLLWRILDRLRRRKAEPIARAATAAALVAGLVVSSVSFGIWQSWWLSTLWGAAALTAPLLAPAKPK